MDNTVLQGFKVGSWTKIPDRLIGEFNELGLTGHQRLIIWALMAYYPRDQISLRDLAARTGMPFSATRNAVSALEKRGLLAVACRRGLLPAYDFQPLLAELARITTFRGEPNTESSEAPPPTPIESPIEPSTPHADDVRFGPTPEDFEKSDAVVRAMEDAKRRASEPSSGQKLELKELATKDLQKRIADVRTRGARNYYPSLGSAECEEKLHDIMHASYDFSEGSTHFDVWMTIEDTYTAWLKELAAATGYDGMAEYMRISGVYSRYTEAHDPRQGHPLEMNEFLIRYYGKTKEFREYDVNV